MNFTSLTRIILGAAALGASAPVAVAEYPEHSIVLVVPSAAGGSLDVLARVLSPYLSKDLGQTVIVENKAGADAMIGISYVANAPADGYTILLSGGAETIAPALHHQLPYDPAHLAAISQFASTPNMIVAGSKLGLKNLSDLIEMAKKRSGGLNAAASGNGSRLSEALFQIKTGAKYTIISFSGTNQVTTSVMSGETDFAIMDSLAFAGMSTASGIQFLAVADTKRLAKMPDVPTTREAGLPDYVIGTLYATYTAGKVQPAIVEKLSMEMKHIVTIPDVIDQLGRLNLQLFYKNPADSQAEYLKQIAVWKDVVAQAHIATVN